EVCYRITKTFPKEEVYGMVSQIRKCLRDAIADFCQ
ncbi:MAG: diversity-generating retroelement protein bAvd family protein, partial [Leptolyngbya sp. SIO4C5]|nr:diversity-generating retroelement protein bAvd family protein [Leptolyngbya sp. SIO4C5]